LGAAPALAQPAVTAAPKVDAGTRSEAQAQPVPAIAPQPLLERTATPAASQFAAALFAAAADRPSAARSPSADAPLAVAPLAAGGGAVPSHAVAAPADVQQGALDMRRREWTGQMIDRIEALRDASPLRETRVSLMPEALGKVDVSIRQEGDRIHVHFSTETQAARQLIADAQPRLVELAEARGVKLGNTSVDSGAAGQGSPRGQQGWESQQPGPRPAAPADETPDTGDDHRVA
jgi:flagellar hook-length control protein FliK